MSAKKRHYKNSSEKTRLQFVPYQVSFPTFKTLQNTRHTVKHQKYEIPLIFWLEIKIHSPFYFIFSKNYKCFNLILINFEQIKVDI